MRIGCGFGGFFYLGSGFYGALAWRAGARRVPVYWQEVAWGTLLFLLWAISYPAPSEDVENSSLVREAGRGPREGGWNS